MESIVKDQIVSYLLTHGLATKQTAARLYCQAVTVVVTVLLPIFWNAFTIGPSHYTTEYNKMSFILISHMHMIVLFILNSVLNCKVLALMDCCYHGFVLFCLTELSESWLRVSLPTGSVLSVVYHRARS